MKRPVLTFVLVFGAGILLSSLLLHLGVVERRFVAPFTALVARASGLVLGLLGMQNDVVGNVIHGEGGFSIDIMNGCNGIDVTAILASAVIAFRSSWKEKLVGLAVGAAGIQIVNLIRIVSLYWLGLKNPAVFEEFHLYVWQTGVIVFSMAIWIFWAEVLVNAPARRGPQPQS